MRDREVPGARVLAETNDHVHILRLGERRRTQGQRFDDEQALVGRITGGSCEGGTRPFIAPVAQHERTSAVLAARCPPPRFLHAMPCTSPVIDGRGGSSPQDN